MKHLVISVLLFLVIIGIIIADSVMLNINSDIISENIDKIDLDEDGFASENNISKIKKIHDFWDEKEFLFDISINNNLFELAEENIINVEEYAVTENYTEYKRSVEVLKDTIERIKDTTKVSFQSVF